LVLVLFFFYADMVVPRSFEDTGWFILVTKRPLEPLFCHFFPIGIFPIFILSLYVYLSFKVSYLARVSHFIGAIRLLVLTGATQNLYLVYILY
jgi:hypothetical protein